MYKRVRNLGSGYFGVVWLERDLGLDRLCAAKYINGPCSTGLIDPFAEARSMLMSEHDHVVQVYSAELEDDVPVIRMEYLPDGSVADKHGNHPLAVSAATRSIEDACRGVECLHARGLLHRDLKPANLMVMPTGAVKVSDFGLACKSDQAAYAPIGYIPHLPPEALPEPGYVEGVQGDVYAMGVTLYRLLNGDAFLTQVQAANGRDLQDLITSGALPPRNVFEIHVHDSLRRVVRKATHLDPTKRYRTATVMRHAVEAARPAVSWRPQTSGKLWSWEGEALDGSASWRAELSSVRGSDTEFKIERQRAGKDFRCVRTASGRFRERTTAMKHAEAILQRVAVRGRADP